MFELTTWPRSAWSIFDELESLQENMNRALGHAQANRRGGYVRRNDRYPLLNVWTSDEGLLVEADMPGVDPGAVDLSVMGDQLTISGKIESVPAGGNVAVHRQERPGGAFSRSLKLPFRVDNAHVNAAFKDGILRIKLPRSEEEKPRKIQVQAA